LELPPIVAPYFVAVIALKQELLSKSKEIYKFLRMQAFPFLVTLETYDKIGRAYKRQDEIGTFLCLTVDFSTENTNDVTVRYRDTTNNNYRVKIEELPVFLKELYHSVTK
jgi:glycyl-tRNA synthetase